jgi:hypothetical protein
MAIRFHPHALARMVERGATESDVAFTIERGEQSPANHGRTRFRSNLKFDGIWRDRTYSTKQVEVIAVEENACWLVITVLVRYF